MQLTRFCVGVFLSLSVASNVAHGQTVYERHCAACHGVDRLGGSGPALLPENLRRLKRDQAHAVIRDGRPATQMPGFGEDLAALDIEALVELIFTPLPTAPVWGEEEIADSHVVHVGRGALVDKPTHAADPLNLFTVVEAGDHHVTILDGDTFTSLVRFPSRFALHGGAKYSPDGRFVYLASRDGWISKYDLWGFELVAEIRAGINTRNAAVSGDGRFVAVGNYLPHSVVILDAADLSLLKIVDAVGVRGQTSRVSAVYAAPPRDSFVVALKDVPEIWEIATSEDAGPFYAGLVHSFEQGMEEGLAAESGLFAVRRIVLDDYLDDFFFDAKYQHVVGAARNAKNGQVVNLIVGRKIAELSLGGMPHLGSGIYWQQGGRDVMATPHLGEGVISVIDMKEWRTIKSIETLGPGFFMRSHPSTPYLWADVFFGPDKDAVHVIDKESLAIVETLRPEPGKTAAHVEFTRDGRFALVSVWDNDGALVVYDAATLEIVKRIPMNKPVGKYNVFNKIGFVAGTSH